MKTFLIFYLIGTVKVHYLNFHSLVNSKAFALIQEVVNFGMTHLPIFLSWPFEYL